MGKTMRFNINISNVEKVNPLFSSCSIRVLYTGINRNNSYISKDTVERALPSIFNIPIVGEYLENKDNFGGHGGKLEITDTDIKWIQTTKPFGTVPDHAHIYWENITENNGDINEYLVIDGAYLWTGRYAELNDLLNRQYGHSMEIEILDASFAIKEGVETLEIRDFLFSALCILGVDKDGEGHVEPAFESASIVAYSLDKDEFTKQFNQMIAELKFSLSKGGTKMEENFEQVTETVEETTTEEVVTTDENFETVEETIETVESTEEVIETSTEEVVEETVVEEVVDYQAKFEALEQEFINLKENFTTLETEVYQLREFKSTKLTEERTQAETELFERFTAELSEEEIAQVKETASEFTLEQIEEKLFTLVGKKKATFSKQTKKEKTIKIGLDFENDNEVDNKPYSTLITKYSKA